MDFQGGLFNYIKSKGKSYNPYLVDYGINKIINKLITINGNRVIPIRSNTGSPYIDSGSTGFIKLLFMYNKKI
ncbi:hypothetical protein ABGF49_06625 [Helcococcus ovis]|uniref:hypothetical protein n=1 Tax=Helcococcus TaxID=31983 RepID=UPI0038BA496B